MAVLSENARLQIWRGIMRYISSNRESVGISKADLRAAINAVDDWVDSNATSFNTAIPQPARAALTVGQKAFLLAIVTLVRVNPELARKVLGEID